MKNEIPLSSLYRDDLSRKNSDLVQRLGKRGLRAFAQNIIPTPMGKGYRSRIKIRFYSGTEGFRATGISPVQGECPVGEILWLLPEWFRNRMPELIDFYGERSERYPVDGMEVLLAHGRKRAHLVLSVKKSHSRSFREFSVDLMASLHYVAGVAVPSQKLESGDSFLNHSICGWDIWAHYRAFFQSNLSLTPFLVREVRQCALSLPCAKIVDLYSGVGLFSLAVAREKRCDITGVDSNLYAIESARKNAASSKPPPGDFLAMSVESFLSGNRLSRDDLVLVNPPRAGCSRDVREKIAENGPHHLIMISCCPETQLRDVAFFREKGYSIKSFKAFDMFPFTEFLETVVLLEKK